MRDLAAAWRRSAVSLVDNVPRKRLAPAKQVLCYKNIMPKPRPPGRRPLPKGRARSFMLRVLVSPLERKTWTEAADVSHGGTMSSFVRDRVNASLAESTDRVLIPVSAACADRMRKIGVPFDALDGLINAALDRDEAEAKHANPS